MTDNNDDTIVYQIHDKFFHNILNNKDVAQDFLLNYSPKLIREQGIFEEITPYKTKFVSPQLKEYRGDIIYKIPLRNGRTALAFMHLEHFSNPKRSIPLYMQQCTNLILIEYHENHPDEDLPLVFSCIVYTGKNPYGYSTDLFDLFGENKEIAKEWMTKPIKLIDVGRLSDEEIKSHQLTGIAEYAFKHRYEMFEKLIRNLFLFFEAYFKNFNDTTYADNVVKYLMVTMPDSDLKVLRRVVEEHFTESIGEKIMNAGQQLIQEGRQEGMKLKEIEIAKSFLKQGVDLKIIERGTQLSIVELKKLKAEMELV